MKKILLVVLSVMVSGAVVWAVSVSSVTQKASGDSVSFADFNSLIGSMKGIFNTGKSENKHHIGINIESKGRSSSLIIKELMVVQPGASEPECNVNLEGSIFAENGGDKHLWGCNGTSWVQLDTDAPVCN